MRTWILFAIILGIVASFAYADDSLYASADAGKFTDAARAVLIRALTRSARADTLFETDTIYVAYPSQKDPPAALLRDLFIKGAILEQWSKLPSNGRPNLVYFRFLDSRSPDTLKTSIGLSRIPRWRPGQPGSKITPTHWNYEVTVVHVSDKWEILRWEDLGLSK